MRPSGKRPVGVQAACPLLDDPLERAVVVVGVIELAAASGDDAPCAALAQIRRGHRVLAVIAALALRQARFAVIECPALIGGCKRATRLALLQRLARFSR